ncbi:hypothetical protein A4R26_13805 [Niastella populi]|uniref:FAS1 domain-containing protein n=2 Tax=Niastella populi TaxID=550983 RepID=A0A1V9G6C7_9BACT|nr:hypothetical protein A4R26_13805 [Niastella populi]
MNYKNDKMRKSLYTILFAGTLASMGPAGCKKWDDHNAITDEALTSTLFEQISADTSLSRFTELLSKSGYDKLLSSSITYTVYAPDNAALANLDAAIVNDTTQLRRFVGNHIGLLTYLTSATSATQRIAMVNGKYHNILGATIENADIKRPDQRAKNGVFHIINKMLPALNNCWEALTTNSAIPSAQKNYLLSLFMKIYDTSNAVQTGVNPTTGEPVYQPGTDSVMTNRFWRSVYDLTDESKQYTFFVLADTAWNSETVKFSPYYTSADSLSTASLAKWYVVKDFAFEGAYNQATLPDTLVSKSNVKVPVDKSAIVQTITTSNGVIYIMKKMAVPPENKIQQFVIQGEDYYGTSIDKRGNTYFRDRYNSLTQLDFRDVLVYNHGVSSFSINYRIFNVPSMKYKAYWVALNDFQSASFNQKLAIDTSTSTTLAYKAVPPNTYSEMYVGDVTIDTFRNMLNVYLVGAASTSAAANPLVCDYIRLEPNFQ